MKKQLNLVYTILFAILAFSFAACGDSDDDSDAVPSESIVGTWKGYSEGHKPTEEQMEARFYEDGTCKIWWYHNPLLCSYYFEGTYTATRKKLHIEGLLGDQGDRPSIEYSKTVNYSVKEDQLKFEFDLGFWILSKK